MGFFGILWDSRDDFEIVHDFGGFLGIPQDILRFFEIHLGFFGVLEIILEYFRMTEDSLRVRKDS